MAFLHRAPKMLTEKIMYVRSLTQNRSAMRQDRLFANGITVLIGIVLGVAAASLITRDSWLLAIAIVCTVPAIVFLNKYPLAALIVWFLVMPLLPFQTTSPSVFWIIHRALMPGALGLTILARMLRIKPARSVYLGWAELAMLLCLAYAAVSVLLTRRSPLLHLYELYDRMLVPFSAYLLIRLQDWNWPKLKWLIMACLITCVIQILIGFWAFYAPETLPFIWDISRMDSTRMSGAFDNPTPYAYTLAFCMVIVFHYAMNYAQKTARLRLVFLFSIGLLCIFLTFTRGCWAAALIVLAGLLVMYPKTILSLLAVALPVIAILSVSVFSEEMDLALERLGTQDTVDNRIILAHAGQQMFYARPIFGWGFGSYDRYDWQFMESVSGVAPTKWDIKHGTSHNTYLTILAETGVVGFFLQFFPFFWWLWQTSRLAPRLLRERDERSKLLIGLWLTILFYVVASQVVDMCFFWFPVGTLWISLGLIGSMVQYYNQPKGNWQNVTS